MDMTVTLTIAGLVVGTVIGIWQIILAQKQVGQVADKAKSDEVSADPKILVHSLKWNKSANLFWLSHDLMLSYHLLLRNASHDAIKFGLRQSLHHIQAIGFADISALTVEKQLSKLNSEFENLTQKELTRVRREIIAQEVAQIIKYVGTLAEVNQPDFIPYASEYQNNHRPDGTDTTKLIEYETATNVMFTTLSKNQ